MTAGTQRLSSACLLLALTLGLAAVPLAAKAPAKSPAPPAASPPAIDPGLLAGLRARSIGPAVVSGRVAAVEAAPSDPAILYVGAAAGGVWKSIDAGLTWEPVFDDQPVASIGAIAVHPQSPDIVWVGTGEGNPRNSVAAGNGVYKSLDGGKTWAWLGLAGSERIPRIVLHPTDPKVAWVAALGPAWSDGAQRGVFKTEDGGKTWRKVLYVDERTGAADLVAEPGNPSHLLAALWQYRRWPWAFRSGGPGSGLFESRDGGETWKRLTEEDGLPKGDLGRIALAFAPGDPRRAYALVEARESALLRSDDGGRSWKSANSEPNVTARPFYFSHIAVDPQDADRLYRLEVEVRLSEDAGKTWSVLVPFRDVHPDYHAIWIDPRDGRQILLGNDGGVAISHDRGHNWGFVTNLPIPQFYHVRVDDAEPYNVYGGLQDNGAWRGPSTVWEGGGIRNFHWREVDFGDGFDTAPDPRDNERGYALSQGGALVRWDLKKGERKEIRPVVPIGPKLRFNWNAGFAVDPFAPDTIYLGSQFVHRSTDRGETWTAISPDLTTDRKEWQRQELSGGLTVDATAAENFTTILAISPSPRGGPHSGLLWVGTDDGRLHVTRDGGTTWQSVEGNVAAKVAPAGTWIPHITPSQFDAGTAYVVFDNHRRGDPATYVARTTDFGKTWRSLATPDLSGAALAIAEDPVDRDLLFLGTELGLWLSLDGGQSWLPYRGIPTTPVMDLAIQPREGDLVVATHGRGMYIIDDIRPLRGLRPATLHEPLHLFGIPDARQHRVAQPASSHFPGTAEYHGDNRPYGALVTFSLNAPGLPLPEAKAERAKKDTQREREREKALAADRLKAAETFPPEAEAPVAEGKDGKDAKDGKKGKKDDEPKVRIEILDAGGKLVRAFEEKATLGLNRVAWDLARNPYKSLSRRRNREARGGPEVTPGVYRVRVSFGDHSAEGQVTVLPDPRVEVTAAAQAAREEAIVAGGALQETLATAVERIGRTQSDIEAVVARIKKDDEERQRREGTKKDDPAVKALLDAARKLGEDLKTLERRLWQPTWAVGQLPDSDATSQLERTLGSLQSSWDGPTLAQLAQLEHARKATKEGIEQVNRFYAEDVTAFRQKVGEAALRLLAEAPPL